MWKTNELGKAQWLSDGETWDFDARGGQAGIQFCDCTMASVDDDRLPVAAEQFVRGDQWHVNFPQDDGTFSLRLVFYPIRSTANQLVIEVCTSIQTDLLDTHPKIDVGTKCEDIDSFIPTHPSNELLLDHRVAGTGCAPISLAKAKGRSVAILLGPHDSPFTSDHSTDMQLRLRLFGEFLEKGVIRRARPWIVINRNGSQRPTQADLRADWNLLVASPIPLT